MYEPFKALDQCDPHFLAKVADRLKGSDGEGWAVGNAIEKYLTLRKEEEIEETCATMRAEPPMGLSGQVAEVEKLTDGILAVLGQRMSNEVGDAPAEPYAWDIIAAVGTAEERLAIVRRQLGTVLHVVQEARNRLDN